MQTTVHSQPQVKSFANDSLSPERIVGEGIGGESSNADLYAVYRFVGTVGEGSPQEGREGESYLNDLDGILPNAKSNFSLNAWEKWSLPGHGKAYDDCGTLQWKGCLNVAGHDKTRSDGVSYKGKIFLKYYKRNCQRAECPVCYKAWASKEAHRIERRLRAYHPNQFRKVIHVIVSPTQNDVDTLDYQALRKKAYFVLEKVGVYGAVVIIHPFRSKCTLGCDSSQKKTCKNKGHLMEWYLSPHFHVLGYGWVSKVGDTHKQTGWIVRNLGIRQSVYATAMYQLSHAGVYMRAEGEKGKKATVTWFGALSYNKFKAPKEELRELCPICEQPLVLLRWTGVGDPPLVNLDNLSENEGEYFIEYQGKDWEERTSYEWMDGCYGV